MNSAENSYNPISAVGADGHVVCRDEEAPRDEASDETRREFREAVEIAIEVVIEIGDHETRNSRQNKSAAYDLSGSADARSL